MVHEPTPRALGSGTSVGRIGLGCMPLSIRGRPDAEQARSVIRGAVEAGVTLFDTADVYALDHTDIGHNERLIAGMLTEMGLGTGAGSPVVVATKGGRTRPDGRWEHDARPESLRAACEASLEALGTECIALYQLHAPDPGVPLADSVGALARLREEGKVRDVGVSNVSVPELEVAMGVVPVVSVQNALSPWALAGRRNPVVERCEREGILFLAYSPLGGRSGAGTLGACEPLRALAAELGATPHELALAALLDESRAVLPIPGASRPGTVDSSVRAAELALTPAQAARVRDAFASLPGWPSPLRRAASRLRGLLGR